MSARAAASLAPEVPSATSAAVFDRLLSDILSGRFARGTRLPAERDLARTLGVSRPTLRSALRTLEAWHLVSPRRGSGIEVLGLEEAGIDVLPAYLRVHAEPRVVLDLLSLRRQLVVQIVKMVAGRIGPGQLDPARQAIQRAWDARGDAATFVREDFGLMREVVRAAAFWPGLWLLNSLRAVYVDLASNLPPMVPSTYATVYRKVMDALEAHDGEEAGRLLEAYFERHDRGLVEGLGFSARRPRKA
jgi:DNA-binding FadR family transcriptional regulator